MTKTNLKLVLDTEHFDPKVYSLEGGIQNDRLCLSSENGIWSVYYTERGVIFDEQRFMSESDACEELLRRLRELPQDQTRLCL